MLLLSSN